MIYLIHGENLVDSRRALIKLKLEYKDIQVLESKKTTEKNLEEKLRESTNLLFGGKSALLLENFSGEWKILPKDPPVEIDIILWSPKKLKPVPAGIKSLNFDTYKNLSAFKLADALLFKNEKQALEILHELLEAKEPPEKILGALTRNFSLAYAAKTQDSLPIPEFIYEKINQQTRVWDVKQIRKAFYSLIKADLEIKEGAKSQVVLNSLIGKLTI